MSAVPELQGVPLANRCVLLRVDFNVPLKDGCITDDARLRATLPTLRLLLEGGAKVICMSHLGRPKGKPVAALSLKPVAERLSELLGQPVRFVPQVVGPEVETAADALQPGQVLLLENLRFEPGEERNDPQLAAQWARLADLYVNDAFGAAHRAHASTAALAALLPHAAGLLMARELQVLGGLLQPKERPFVCVLGGAKISDKIGVLEHLLQRVDQVILGGGMANTFLLAQGHEIGASLAEPDQVELCRDVLRRAGPRLLLPLDVQVAPGLDRPQQARTVAVEQVPKELAIFDVGPKSIAHFAGVVGAARTLFWNGPLGVFEVPPFDQGTLGMAQAVAACPGLTVVGGGDSLAAIERSGVGGRIGHLSTGGGASLEFLEGRVLPGVVALEAAVHAS